jgi:hypothetical protein
VGVAAIVVLASTRRIDLDRDDLTLVPILPLLPRRSVPLDLLGEFRLQRHAGRVGNRDVAEVEAYRTRAVWA